MGNVNNNRYKVKAPDDATFTALRQFLSSKNIQPFVISEKRRVFGVANLSEETQREIAKLGGSVTEDLQYDAEGASLIDVGGSFTRTLEMPAQKVAAIVAGLSEKSGIELAPSAWPGRFVLLGRNPAGTLPLFGTIAVEPVMAEHQPTPVEAFLGGYPTTDPSATHCTVTVETRPDPIFRNSFQPVYQRAAEFIGENLVRAIAKEAGLTL